MSIHGKTKANNLQRVRLLQCVHTRMHGGSCGHDIIAYDECSNLPEMLALLCFTTQSHLEGLFGRADTLILGKHLLSSYIGSLEKREHWNGNLVTTPPGRNEHMIPTEITDSRSAARNWNQCCRAMLLFEPTNVWTHDR